MKSEIKKETIVKLGYPKLMVGDISGMIVMFSAPSSGTVVSSSTHVYDLGFHSNAWAMEDFADLPDTTIIELSNK